MTRKTTGPPQEPMPAPDTLTTLRRDLAGEMAKTHRLRERQAHLLDNIARLRDELFALRSSREGP